MTAEERQAWLAARRKGIGGSDIAAVMNRSPYGGPRSVWESKVHSVESDIDPERAYWGNAKEPLIINRFREDHPELDVRRFDNLTFRLPAWPVAIASLDGDARDARDGGGRDILEAKNISTYARGWEADGVEDGVPEHIRLQVLWYMGVTGTHSALVLSLHDGWDYRVNRILWDAELFDLMLGEAKLFWEAHVLTGIPPSPDSPAQMRMLFPRDNGELLTADAELRAFILDRVEAGARAKAMATIVSRLDAEIMGRMEWNEHLDLEEGVRAASWKAPAKGRADYKAATADLRQRLRMGDKKFNALLDEHRAAPGRTFRFTLKSED